MICNDIQRKIKILVTFNEIESLRASLDSEKAHRERLLDSLTSEKNANRLATEKEHGEYEAALVSIRSQPLTLLVEATLRTTLHHLQNLRQA